MAKMTPATSEGWYLESVSKADSTAEKFLTCTVRILEHPERIALQDP
jgi:hypothetical protein